MVLVVWQAGGRFRRRAPQKHKESSAEEEEKGIVDHYFFLSVHRRLTFSCKIKWGRRGTVSTLIMNIESCSVNFFIVTFPTGENLDN